MADGPVACAARINARLVSDFDPGTVTVARTGCPATGAGQPAVGRWNVGNVVELLLFVIGCCARAAAMMSRWQP
jgi:hypothetical protein